MQLHGLHHVTAVTGNAPGNHDFFTRIMGMRLVKRTVNQDDVSAYHLFYGDGEGRPGSDLTFFDWPVPRERRGSHSIVRTGLRVADGQALGFWRDRFAELGVTSGEVTEIDGRASLPFEDPEGQRLMLLVDGGEATAAPWAASPVPVRHQVRGLGPVTASVRRFAASDQFMTEVLAMRRVRTYPAPDAADLPVHVYEMGEGGPAAELHLRVDEQLAAAQSGAGGVHHVAFRVPDGEYGDWVDRLKRLGIRSSGPVDRFYFRSLYAREPGGILCEIATDGPGFATDEGLDTLGERLSLPPFLEAHRGEIERGLKPL